jgi:energy-coupling factor transporter ATP-binding protein EcfA2
MLHDVTLTIPAGTVTCIIGRSGSGRSTLPRCLNHLVEPSGGDIRLDGERALSWKPDRPRRRGWHGQRAGRRPNNLSGASGTGSPLHALWRSSPESCCLMKQASVALYLIVDKTCYYLQYVSNSKLGTERSSFISNLLHSEARFVNCRRDSRGLTPFPRRDRSATMGKRSARS